MQEQSIVLIVVALIGAAATVTSTLIVRGKRTTRAKTVESAPSKPIKRNNGAVLDNAARALLVGTLYFIGVFFGITGLANAPDSIIAAFIFILIGLTFSGAAYFVQQNWRT